MTTAASVTLDDDDALTTRILSFTTRASRVHAALIVVFGGLAGLFFAVIAYTLLTGIGTWGNNVPVAWCFAITNFVWWIGIGHAGTFISAIALLLRQSWRTSINRIAESMTLFALAQAALFPLLHLGRAWFFYWLVPYPSRLQVWPQFRSSLTWDIGAVTTYTLVSILFWYLGLIPDLAAARDGVDGRVRKRIYGAFALGWRGTARHWSAHAKAATLLAGLATPLVVSVHSVVSLDFAIGLVSGWHSTMFPPYFVTGALLSGFAMLLSLLIPIRWAYGLQDLISPKHLDVLAKIVLSLSLLITWFYATETYLTAMSDDARERSFSLGLRPFGPYAFFVWLTVVCNCFVPQLLWAKRVRSSTTALFLIAALVNVGMWFERFVIIAGSLSRDFVPSSWAEFRPSWVDFALLAGSLCFFAFLFLLFLRFVPFIPLSELREQRRHG